MTYSLFDRCGWNPTEVHARLHGRKPGGIVVVTAKERGEAAREFAEREHAEREARAREQAELEVKAAADPPRHGEGDRPSTPPAASLGTGSAKRRGRGAPSDCPDASGAEPTRETLTPSGADADVPESLLWPLHHASHGPPPRADEDEDQDEDDSCRPPDPASCLDDWLVHNWETIKALEAAGKMPELSLPEETGDEAGEDAAPPLPLPPIHVRKGDRWNRPKMADFLRQLAATHSVSAAARSVGMSRESAYRLRNRLKGQPFDIAWEAAFRQGYDNLAHAALDRAVNGVEVPHYCNGELVGTSRRYDERLTVALLAMRNRYGAPQMGRYGAAAEWWSERWDAMLQRVESGSLDWQDEQRALGQPLDGGAHVQALINKHAPDEGPVTPRRR